MGRTYKQTLVDEAKTWLLEDDAERAEKILRERIRHYKLIRDLLLDKLGTHTMSILEVGGGPVPLSDLLQYRYRHVADPLSDEYRKFFPCPDHRAVKAEDLDEPPIYDLVICTNALDHVEMPSIALGKMKDCIKPGGYIALMCAENNAITNPHPCHVHNLSAEWAHLNLDKDFETVWELTFRKDNYRYGWVEFEGKRGQPAWALLMRKCTGY